MPELLVDFTSLDGYGAGSRTFDGRIQMVEYVPRVLDGPQSACI